MDAAKIRPKNKEQIEKITKENEAITLERANRYHKVFVQNADGAKLLEQWMNDYTFGGFTSNDATHTALAKAEARREFVAMIVKELNISQRG